VVEVADPRPIKSPKDDGETVKKDAEAFTAWVEGEYAPGLSPEPASVGIPGSGPTEELSNRQLPNPEPEVLAACACSPTNPSPPSCDRLGGDDPGRQGQTPWPRPQVELTTTP
jgi:hypothetical protein